VQERDASLLLCCVIFSLLLRSNHEGEKEEGCRGGKLCFRLFFCVCDFCRHNIIINIITTDVFCFKCSGFWFHSLDVVAVLLLLFSPHDDARNCGLLSFIPPFVSAAAVVLLGFLQNREYKKRAKLSFERSVFCLSVCLLQVAFFSRNSLFCVNWFVVSFYVGGHSDLSEYQIEDPSSC